MELLSKLLLYIPLITCFIPNKTFDIRYINLTSETKRKEHMEAILSTARCKYTRFNAVNGRALWKGVEKIKDYTHPLGLNGIQIPDFEGVPDVFMGMVGCKLSHYIHFRMVEKSHSNKPVLVLENDVDLEVDFVQQIETTLAHMPENWDILLVSPYFGTDNSEPINENPSTVNSKSATQLNNKILKVSWFFETSGFIINGSRAAKKIADIILNENEKYTPIDLFLRSLSMNKRILIYALEKKLVIQLTDVFHSSIPTSDKIPQISLINSLAKETVRMYKLKGKPILRSV